MTAKERILNAIDGMDEGQLSRLERLLNVVKANADTENPFLGMFAGDRELIDEITESAMKERERRNAGPANA